MKKLLGISLVAVLATAPLMASADEVTYTNPSAIAANESGLAENGTNVVKATNGKYFAGKQIASTDAERVATGAYVKGAYNAAISAINKVAEDISDTYATQEGVVNTIKSSYVEEVVTDAELTGGAGVTALTTWGSDDTTTTMGAASLTVTRGNKAVKVARTGAGTTQDPYVEYRTSAVNLTSSGEGHLDIIPDTETKTTPATNPAWTAPSNS